MPRNLVAIGLWAVLAAAVPLPCPAQEPAPAVSENERMEQLQRQLEELEERLQEIRDEIETYQKPKPEVVGEELPEPVEAEPPEEIAEELPQIDIGGALRFNYALRSFDEDSKARGGDFEFDIFRIDVDGRYKDLTVSAQYRWYSFMDVIHHGWVGYDFTDQWHIEAGITQVPFGLLPYASHNWWFGVPYYIGLEDDYDMGLKSVYAAETWELQLAFFKNGEWGSPSKLERYSYDVVIDESNFPRQANEETNQFNARLAYTFEHSGLGSTEVGLSGQYGQLFNSITDGTGDHWAAAAHLNGYYGPFNLMLEAARYGFDPDNPADVDDDQILMGAFAVAAPVAAQGTVYVANLAYDVPVEWGPISLLTFYNDYSILVKDADDFNDSQINTLGCLVTAGPLYTYIDFILGKNAQFLGGGSEAFGAARDSDDDWNARFNINVGYYF